jgi:hypothetical protein
VNAASDKVINQTRKESVDPEHPTRLTAENAFGPIASKGLKHGLRDFLGRHAALKINFHSPVIAQQVSR